MSAGRCELCNKLLYLDSNFGDSANFAENAHIHAVGAAGPRHEDEMDENEINQIDNLMLLCAEHHHLIDTKPENYPADYLVRKKESMRHEFEVLQRFVTMLLVKWLPIFPILIIFFTISNPYN